MKALKRNLSKATIGLISLWIGMLIGASANAIIAKITALGALHLIHGRNPISFCNILFASNVVAGVCFYLIYHKIWKLRNLKPLTPMAWMCMSVVALLGAVLAPTFYFFSLVLTSVNNVVLISTLYIPLSLLVGWIFFKDRPDPLVFIGAFIALIGVVLIYILTFQETTLSKETISQNIGPGPIGHFFTLIPQPGKLSAVFATCFSVIGAAVSRKNLQFVSMGIYLVFRMLMGTILFMTIALLMFGPHHFTDLLSPFLWEWMVVYGGVVIVLGIFFWSKGVQLTSSAEMTTAKAFTPVAGMIFAFLIVGEVPNQGQWIGGAVIILGVFLSLFGQLKSKKMLEEKVPIKKPAGFSGV